MLASAVLQTSVNAYRDAGLSEESQQVRILMQEKIGQARDHMGTFETEIKISRDDMEEFLKAVVVDDIRSTFVRIAAQFLPNRRHLEEAVQKSLQQAPLSVHMPRTIMADNHVAAKIGSVHDDPSAASFSKRCGLRVFGDLAASSHAPRGRDARLDA